MSVWCGWAVAEATGQFGSAQSFADKAIPLKNLLVKGKEFVWSEACQTSFETLVKELVTLPILTVPDWTEPFVLETDASADAIGAVLTQKGRPIAFASRTLSKEQRNYGAMERELLAVIEFYKYFDYYLTGTEFTIITDSQPVNYLFGLKDPKGRLARWVMEFQELHVWHTGQGRQM